MVHRLESHRMVHSRRFQIEVESHVTWFEFEWVGLLQTNRTSFPNLKGKRKKIIFAQNFSFDRAQNFDRKQKCSGKWRSVLDLSCNKIIYKYCFTNNSVKRLLVHLTVTDESPFIFLLIVIISFVIKAFNNAYVDLVHLFLFCADDSQ